MKTVREGFSDLANQFEPGALTYLKRRHLVENSWGLLRVLANQFEPSAPSGSGRRHLVENSWGLINLKSKDGGKVEKAERLSIPVKSIRKL